MVEGAHAPVKSSTLAVSALGKTMKKPKATSVRAVERAIDILDAFSVERPALTVAELARCVRLNRPTLYRMLSTLMQRRLVQLSGDPPRYRLDYGAARFAEAWSRSIEIGQTALPILEPLLHRFDETVALYLRRDNTRICAIELPSRQPLSYSRGLGHAESLRRGASGIAILAFLRGDEFETILGEETGPCFSADTGPRAVTGACAGLCVEPRPPHRGGPSDCGAGLRPHSGRRGGAGAVRPRGTVSSRTRHGMR